MHVSIHRKPGARRPTLPDCLEHGESVELIGAISVVKCCEAFTSLSRLCSEFIGIP